MCILCRSLCLLCSRVLLCIGDILFYSSLPTSYFYISRLPPSFLRLHTVFFSVNQADRKATLRSFIREDRRFGGIPQDSCSKSHNRGSRCDPQGFSWPPKEEDPPRFDADSCGSPMRERRRRDRGTRRRSKKDDRTTKRPTGSLFVLFRVLTRAIIQTTNVRRGATGCFFLLPIFFSNAARSLRSFTPAILRKANPLTRALVRPIITKLHELCVIAQLWW